MAIQWYPGHMHKAKKAIIERLKSVDMVIEVLDARLPASSENPLLAKLSADKPKLKILNKQDLADPERTDIWLAEFQSRPHTNAIALDASDRSAAAKMIAACRKLVPHRKGIDKPLRVLICGIPNVGKSTFINKVAHRKTARAEDRPGVTRSKQWVPVDPALELLDTPGILWPKFDDPEVGKRLAFTGAVKDDVLDIEELACYLMDYLAAHYADTLTERYKIEVEPGDTGYELLEKAGRKRGFLMRGAQVDTERMARILLDEFRAGKLGRFTLETAPTEEVTP